MSEFKRIADVFELPSETVFSQALLDAEITGLTLSMEERSMVLRLRTPQPLNEDELVSFEQMLKSSYVLHSVRTEVEQLGPEPEPGDEPAPASEEQAFTLDCVPAVEAELKKRIPATNGFLIGSEWRQEGLHLAIHLTHGGGDILKDLAADRIISDIIRERYGVTMTVSFEGVLDLDAGGDGGAALGTLDDLWQDVQGYMHIIVSHEDLDEAEALMAQAKALSAQGSTEELYPVLAQLRHQFRLIAETQQLSPKNIF